MKVTVYSLKPFFDVDGGFIDNPESANTFDPKHPRTYAGLEVVAVENLSNDEFYRKYGDSLFGTDIMYQQCRGGRVNVLELTGRTSADVVNAL